MGDDMIMVDQDGDGYAETALADTDGSGVVDTAYVDTNQDGYYETVYRDVNEDGTPDYVAQDADGDGYVDDPNTSSSRSAKRRLLRPEDRRDACDARCGGGGMAAPAHGAGGEEPLPAAVSEFAAPFTHRGPT